MMNKNQKMIMALLFSFVLWISLAGCSLQDKIEEYSRDKEQCYLNPENITQFFYKENTYTILEDIVSNGELGEWIGYIQQYPLSLEEFDMSDYMKRIEMQASSLCFTNKIRFYMETETDIGHFKADKWLLERAIMNVINNALDYSPTRGTIYVIVQKIDHFLQICITDEGIGFSPEALSHAREQFFMGDHSRNSNMHFGLELYITDSIIRQHNGQLILKNSDKTKGAQVIIKIPYKK